MIATFLLGSFLFPKPVNAGCIVALGGCGGGYSTTCSGAGEGFCCQEPGECKDAAKPTSGGGQSTSDVTCGAGGTGIKTAIGCIGGVLSDKGPEEFLGNILKWAVGVGGGVAFLLILYASFMVMSSAGDPERLKAGQELLTSAISGLILLIFSIFILKFIGLDILGLGQLGFSPL